MRQARAEIEKRHPGRFVVGMMSMQGIIMEEDDPDAVRRQSGIPDWQRPGEFAFGMRRETGRY